MTNENGRLTKEGKRNESGRLAMLSSLETISGKLDLAKGHIAESVDRIKEILDAHSLDYPPFTKLSDVVLIGGGSGVPAVGSALYEVGINCFTMLANTSELNRDKRTKEIVGAGLILQEIGDAIDWIDITKQSIHATPEQLRNRAHRLLDSRRSGNMRLGYLFLEALRQKLGTPQQAADFANHLMGNPYRVVPSTQDRTELFFKFRGQELDLYDYALRPDPSYLAESFYLKPAAEISPYAVESLRAAQTIIIGPGDVYFSILPHWAIDGFRKALESNRKAKVILISNLTAREMDIPGFQLSDFLGLFDEYLPKGMSVDVLVNQGKIAELNPLVDNVSGRTDGRYTIVREDIASSQLNRNKQLTHDRMKLGRALEKLVVSK